MEKNVLIFIFFYEIFASPKLNLYSMNFEYDCLRIVSTIDDNYQQIISYCLRKTSGNYENHLSSFTFGQLSQENVTSQQLYDWSTPIDLIEDYQQSSSNEQVFFNCTLPRFGLTCEYELVSMTENQTSLHEIINDYYKSNDYIPIELTCYIHIECDRGPTPSCLDWSEICDGKIDCRNDGIDERHCWQLEMNICQENEYRCMNGQCIPMAFYLDDRQIPDCLDQSDEYVKRSDLTQRCQTSQPLFDCEEIICREIVLTSSCVHEREILLIKALYSMKDESLSDECWSTFKCLTGMPDAADYRCIDYCENNAYESIIAKHCSNMIFIPSAPVLFREIYFAYAKNDSQRINCSTHLFPYICYNNSDYDRFFSNDSEILINDLKCSRSPQHQPITEYAEHSWTEEHLDVAYKQLKKYHFVLDYPSEICRRDDVYQCLNSKKCISIYRLLDNFNDCPENDDEDTDRISQIYDLSLIKKYNFHCQFSNKDIPRSAIRDDHCDCGFITPTRCEDEQLYINYYTKNSVVFHTICDGFVELSPIFINGRFHTDETDCQQWLCDNIYTSCDGLRNCPNGIDETGCYTFSSWTCSSNEHFCISIVTNQSICLPVHRTNDGHIDCIGASDEPTICYKNNRIFHTKNFYCLNSTIDPCISVYNVCDGIRDCPYGDDERICEKTCPTTIRESICLSSCQMYRSVAEEFLCRNFDWKEKKQNPYFILDSTNNSLVNHLVYNENTEYPPLPWNNQLYTKQPYCHRGFPVRFVPTNKTKCFCPPSSYGDRCQYQNQRLSLSLRFRASSHSWQTPFAILILLIDDTRQRIVHSYEQLTYLSIRDCQKKFHFYLIYSTQPKSIDRHYSLHIDIYEKQSLIYRTSLQHKINFSFLPVHRLAFIIDIPQQSTSYLDANCANDSCGPHGQCVRYFKDQQNSTFCQCQSGWTGQFCTIKYNCSCSPTALCAGLTAANQSICICPLHQFGRRCFLTKSICFCQNRGECVPNDDEDGFTCVCPRGFMGQRCEIAENQLMISFHQNLILPESIFIHFIQVLTQEQPRRATTFRSIPFKRESIVVHWPQPFHLVFIEFSRQQQKFYFLTLRQNHCTQSIVINTTVSQSDRCQHINELFNQTIVQSHLLVRIKFYQTICQSNKISCFYDDIYLCLCQMHKHQRVSNCLEFNHNMTFDCLGQSVCQNGAQCFQDSGTCPQRSMCICPSCYYGRLCQFSTSGFSVSLDAILGYHIQPNIKLTEQTLIVQMSILTMNMILIGGLVNGYLTLITFKTKVIRNVGCGIYLLASSINTLVTTIIVGLKFWILILAQSNFITNKIFLLIQCYSIDFLVRCCLNIDQWLAACVAIERAMTTIKGTSFNKKKSQTTAKFMLIIIVLCVIGTNIHDCFSRRLINEENYEDETRLWCIVSYSTHVRIYNSVMNIFHFLTPFICHLLATIILLTKKSHFHSLTRASISYRTIFLRNIREHRHLLLAPFVLILLALPRLIISFSSKCIKSGSDSWLFLFGYTISLIPPMITFIIFILPSKFYRRQFYMIFIRYRKNIQRYFHGIFFSLSIRISNTVRPL